MTSGSPTYPLVERARELAQACHQGQTYGRSLPYTYHLRRVVCTLQEFGVREPELLAAGWLHDVLEDTNLTRTELALQVGERVTELVWRVTNEPGPNRRSRHALTYPKLRQDADAVLLKLADRTANVRASAQTPSMLQLYRDEHPAFRAALYQPGQHEAAWHQLELALWPDLTTDVP